MGLFGDRLLHHLVDVGVALVGDDALGVIVQLLLAVRNVGVDVGQRVGVQVQFRLHLFVPLEQLDRVPTQKTLVHFALDALLDVGQRMFHTAGKHVGQFAGAAILRGFHRGQCGLVAALPLEGADLHRLAAQRIGQLFQINGVAVFAHQIDHIDGHHHRQAQFDELGSQVEVAFNVGAVQNVENGVRLFPHQIAAGHDLLQRVGGQRINARKVLNDDVLIAFQAALLFLHRDAGPVAHILVGAGQRVEQRGFAAVRVAGQCDLQFHETTPFYAVLQLAIPNHRAKTKRRSAVCYASSIISASALRTLSSYPRTFNSMGSPSGATLRT